MTYPEGNVIARNLATRPKFDSSLAYAPWECVEDLGYVGKVFTPIPVNVEKRDWTGGEYRLGTSSGVASGMYRLPLPVEALRRGVKVSLDYISLTAASLPSNRAELGLMPVLKSSGTDYTYVAYQNRVEAGSWDRYVPTTVAATLQHYEATLQPLPETWTVANSGGYKFTPNDWAGAHLVFKGPAQVTTSGTGVLRIRVDYMDTPAKGYFDGDTADTDAVVYSWDGTLPATSTATQAQKPVTPGPGDPGPTEPEPEDPDDGGVTVPPLDPNGVTDAEGNHYLARRAVAFLGRAGDAEALELANAQLPVVEAFVYGYTRGRGFPAFGVAPAEPVLQNVIVSAVGRLLANPDQVKQYQVGDYMERGAVLNGWTLAELAILNRYRRRAGAA